MKARQLFRLGMLLLIVFAVDSPAWAQTGVQCRTSHRMSCTATACVPAEITTWANINFDTQAYARCDRNGCERYPATFSTRGSFTDIDFPGRAMMAKINIKDGSFVEVETIAMRVLVSHGACK